MLGQIWNYSFTVPCALLMVTLVAFYFSRRRLPVRLNKVFLALLALQLAVMVFDVGSSIADEHYQELSSELLYVLNTAFFVLFNARAFAFFMFTLEILPIKNRRPFVLTTIPFWIAEALSISSFATGAVFYIDSAGYHSGPLYNVLYVCFYFYIALSVIVLFVRAKSLRKDELASAFAFNLVLFAGCIVRYLFPNLLAMNTFCVVAILIIYLAFLNPDLFLVEDRHTFNMHGFETLLWDWGVKREYQIIGLALKNFNYERGILGTRQTEVALSAIAEYLAKTFPETFPFYLRNGRYAMVFSGSQDWEEMQRAISERFLKPWQVGDATVSMEVVFAHASSKSSRGGADRIAGSLLIALDEAGDSQGPMGEGDETRMVDQKVDTLQLLERALAEDGVEVFLQPLVDGTTNEMVAAEALARIRDDDGSIVSPELFIPLAEKSGHISQLDDQVLEKVCAFVRSHDMDALGLRWINVNLSPIQCMQPGIADHLAATLARHGVDSDFIHLEITEESMVDYVLLERQVKSMRGLGFQFALDDYGSGYSNLTRVKHYPFANIKIDREVVWGYCRDHDTLLPAIVQSFREMGFSVTAEGIETEEMARNLVDIGCAYLQGFLYSKPLPMEEFLEKYGQSGRG